MHVKWNHWGVSCCVPKTVLLYLTRFTWLFSAKYEISLICLTEVTVWTVLLHNGGFCNGCITRRCLNNSTKVSYNDFVSRLSLIKDESNQQLNVFCHILSNNGVLIWQVSSSKPNVLWRTHFRIHCYAAAPFELLYEYMKILHSFYSHTFINPYFSTSISGELQCTVALEEGKWIVKNTIGLWMINTWN